MCGMHKHISTLPVHYPENPQLHYFLLEKKLFNSQSENRWGNVGNRTIYFQSLYKAICQYIVRIFIFQILIINLMCKVSLCTILVHGLRMTHFCWSIVWSLWSMPSEVNDVDLLGQAGGSPACTPWQGGETLQDGLHRVSRPHWQQLTWAPWQRPCGGEEKSVLYGSNTAKCAGFKDHVSHDRHVSALSVTLHSDVLTSSWSIK